MKKFLLAALVMTSMSLSATETNPIEDPKTVNVEESTIVWTGKKVTGEHTGTINIKAGSLDFTDGALTGGSFTIDMTTIKCTDLDGEYGAKLEGHLKSDDFFGVANNPTAELVITKVTRGESTGTYNVTADLTIKGITNPIDFTATVGSENASASVKIDRTKYNIKYKSGSFFDSLGDKMIYDDFDLELTLKY